MSKKGENIYKRKDGRWEGRFLKERKNNGKIRYGYVYDKSYRGVKEKLIEKKLWFQKQDPSISSFQGSMDVWLDFWLEEVIKNTVKQSTYCSYKSKIDNHVKPYFQQLLLKEITTEDLNDFILQLEKKLSSSSVHAIFQVLKTSLYEAKRRSFVQIEISKFPALPQRKKTRIHILSQEEEDQIRKIASIEKSGLPVLLALETGMRIGEIAGLKWEDINFNSKSLFIKRTRHRIKNYSNSATSVIENSPKTFHSSREIPLSDNMIHLLKSSMLISKSDYVISVQGKPTEPRTINNHFKKMVNELQLENIKFHTIRHSFASKCLERGVSAAVIAALLGHSSVKTTLDIYTISNRNSERRAIELITA